MSYLSVEKKKDIAIITSNNKRIDAAFANQFRQDILALKSEGFSKIVLNLVNVDFIDSSGLGVIVFIAKKTDKQEKLVLCHLNDKVLHILKLANMVDRFSITKNVDEAMTFLNKVMD